jgi:ring-1,2-phenylacetyl-CoA epoxidase subunit PaaC
MHVKGLLVRLGTGTEESHQKMQSALDLAWPQSLGMFESLASEKELVRGGVFPGNDVLTDEWKKRVLPVLASATLVVPSNGVADFGGRQCKHTDHLKHLVSDLQSVYRIAPEAKW